MNHYPKDLTTKPKRTVCLLGYKDTVLGSVLDTQGYAVLSFDSAQAIPKRKERSPTFSFDGYKPSGILKLKWITKHQKIVPSLIVLLLEWSHIVDFASQEPNIERQIEEVKSRVAKRNTRIVVVLLTPSPIPTQQLNPIEYKTIDDYLTALRKRLDFDSKSFYVLTKNYRFNDDASRKFFKAIDELSTAYYRDETKRLRKHKNELNLKVQQQLYARHRFKLGFFLEILDDNPEKYYQHAYNAVLQIPRLCNSPEYGYSDIEIKTTGDYINLKLVTVAKITQKNIDSIVRQLLSHMKWYRQMTGETNMLFEHYGLMYRKYLMAAELLENTLPTLNLGITPCSAVTPQPVPTLLPVSNPATNQFTTISFSSSSTSSGSPQTTITPLNLPPSSIAPLTITVGSSPSSSFAGTNVSSNSPTIASLAASSVFSATGPPSPRVSSASAGTTGTSSSSVTYSTTSFPAAERARYLNAGYFYHMAALCAISRKQHMKKLIDPFRERIHRMHDHEPLLLQDDPNFSTEGYVGQRPSLLPAIVSSLQTKEKLEEAMFLKEAAKEIKVNHTEDITTMLTLAIKHYTQQGWTRQILYLRSLMCSEFIDAQIYSLEAMDHACSVVDAFKQQLNTTNSGELSNVSVYSSALKCLLLCAQKLDLHKIYIDNALLFVSNDMESASSLSGPSLSERKAVLEKIIQYSETATSADNPLQLTPISEPLVFELPTNHQLLQCKVQFTERSKEVFQPIYLRVNIVSNAPLPIYLSSLKIAFNAEKYNLERIATDDELVLLPNKTPNVFEFQLVVKESLDLRCTEVRISVRDTPANKQLQNTVEENTDQAKIASLEPSTATESEARPCFLSFVWNITNHKFSAQLLEVPSSYKYEVDMPFIERPLIRVLEPEPKISFSFVHLPPALINEFYYLRVIIHSNDDDILNGDLYIKTNGDDEVSFFGSTGSPLPSFVTTIPDKADDAKEVQILETKIVSVSFSAIQPNQKHHIELYLHSPVVGVKHLKLKVVYQTRRYKPTLRSEVAFDVIIIPPFDVRTALISNRAGYLSNNALTAANTSTAATQQPQNPLEPNDDAIAPEPQLLYMVPAGSKINVSKASAYVDRNPAKASRTMAMSQLTENEPFMLSLSLICKTPFPISLTKVELLCNNEAFQCVTQSTCTVLENMISPTEISSKGDEELSALLTPSEQQQALTTAERKKTLQVGDEMTLLHVLVPTQMGTGVDLGTVRVTCVRERQENRTHDIIDGFANTVFSMPLPKIAFIMPLSVLAMMSLPTSGYLGQPISMRLHITNNTSAVQYLQLRVEDVDSFVFAGSSQADFTMLPYASHEFCYSAVPLACGFLPLPRFSLLQTTDSDAGPKAILSSDDSWTTFVRPSPLATPK